VKKKIGPRDLILDFLVHQALVLTGSSKFGVSRGPRSIMVLGVFVDLVFFREPPSTSFDLLLTSFYLLEGGSVWRV